MLVCFGDCCLLNNKQQTRSFCSINGHSTFQSQASCCSVHVVSSLIRVVRLTSVSLDELHQVACPFGRCTGTAGGSTLTCKPHSFFTELSSGFLATLDTATLNIKAVTVTQLVLYVKFSHNIFLMFICCSFVCRAFGMFHGPRTGKGLKRASVEHHHAVAVVSPCHQRFSSDGAQPHGQRRKRTRRCYCLGSGLRPLLYLGQLAEEVAWIGGREIILQ